MGHGFSRRSATARPVCFLHRLVSRPGSVLGSLTAHRDLDWAMAASLTISTTGPHMPESGMPSSHPVSQVFEILGPQSQSQSGTIRKSMRLFPPTAPVHLKSQLPFFFFNLLQQLSHTASFSVEGLQSRHQGRGHFHQSSSEQMKPGRGEDNIDEDLGPDKSAYS